MNAEKGLMKYSLTHTGLQVLEWAKVNGVSVTKIPSSVISQAAYEGDVGSFTALVLAGVKIDVEDAAREAMRGKGRATMLSLLSALKEKPARGLYQMVVHVALSTDCYDRMCIVAKLPIGTAFDPREHRECSLFDREVHDSFALDWIDLLHIRSITRDFEVKQGEKYLGFPPEVGYLEASRYPDHVKYTLQERRTGTNHRVRARYEDNRWVLNVDGIFESGFDFWLKDVKSLHISCPSSGVSAHKNQTPKGS